MKIRFKTFQKLSSKVVRRGRSILLPEPASRKNAGAFVSEAGQ